MVQDYLYELEKKIAKQQTRVDELRRNKGLNEDKIKKSQDQEVTGMCLGVVNARSNGVVASSFGRNRPNLTKTLVNFAKLLIFGAEPVRHAKITTCQGRILLLGSRHLRTPTRTRKAGGRR